MTNYLIAVTSKYFHVILFYLIFSANIVLANDEVEVTFFDVGQGNGTLIKIPKAPPFLIDAGSTALRGSNDRERGIFKKNQIDKIIERIKEYLPPQQNGIDLNVIISHADVDHYSWISTIVDSKKYGRDLKVRFLLGGAKKEYSQPLINLVNTYKVDNQEFCTENYKSIADIPKFSIGESKFDILSALKDGDDTNAKSIILRLKYGNYSVTLTGDATEKSTEHIKDNQIVGGCKATILQASHHGAATDGSNNDKWLELCDPEYVIFSAGERVDYLHPRSETIKQIIKSCNNINCKLPPHTIQYSGDQIDNSEYIVTYGQLQSGYRIASTKYGLYTTTSQKDISFSWNKNSNTMNPPHVTQLEGDKYLELNQHIIGFLKNTSTFDSTNLICVNLSNFKLDHNQLKTIITVLKKQSNLNLLSLHIEGKESFEELAAFVENYKQLGKLNIKKCGLTNSQTDKQLKSMMKKAWNNRGLEM